MPIVDFISEKTVVRRKRYLAQISLKDLKDPNQDWNGALKDRFMELFGKDSVGVSTFTTEIRSEDLLSNTAEILVTGWVEYFQPRMVNEEDYS